jgi:CO/xanthine dehydrogenase FAD-binding subunit
MKPGAFEYVRPESLEEATAVLGEHGDDAKVLAGGQSLVPLLNMRMARPAVVVDINRVLSLDNIDRTDAAARVGALVRQAVAAGVHPLVDRALPYVGHFVTRNRGTVGGSIAHADASAELPLVLVALAGSVVAASAAGRREIPAESFFLTHFTTCLEPTELVAETVWPQPAPGAGFAFEELALRAGDYALAMAACALRVHEGRAVGTRVAVGSVADRPTLLPEVAGRVDGRELTPEVAREVGVAARQAVDPPDGLHASGAYRRELTGLLVERAVLSAWRDAVGGPA